MDSSNGSSGFGYNLSSNSMGDLDIGSEFSGILNIYVHHARNIHNICIYENQDVYAKFSLTYNPDETTSTRICKRGGKNPDFNENLMMKVTQADAVLKCEIWMLSRIRNYMEDQLLCFALVPITEIAGKESVSQDYTLSTTDLIHSPAGTVKLTLSLNTSTPIKPSTETTCNSSISSEVVLLDRKKSENFLDPVEYSRIEFPDINVVRENQQLVSEFFGVLNSTSGPAGVASFLHLGASQHHVDDYGIMVNSSDQENNGGSISPDGSIQNSGVLSSTITSLSDDRNSADSLEKKSRLGGESSNSLNTTSVTAEANEGTGTSPDTPTSKKGSDTKQEKKEKEEGKKQEGNMHCVKFKQAFPAPPRNINNNLGAEQSAMQQQIVDMYMRSMQQFTESLAKMKLPMDLGQQDGKDGGGETIQNHSKNVEQEKKDGSRVFYGSRAFF
ncbi:hypothetical protein SLE2022_001920 [Rubroshorea leprosula]